MLRQISSTANNAWDIAQLKEVVSVSEMAKMVHLSRARFYSLLQQGVFPQPIYDIKTKRPHYTAELQIVCLNVRKNNRGMNGQHILFYSTLPRAQKSSQPGKKETPQPVIKQNDKYIELAGMLKQLGVETTPDKVASAVKELFPDGIQGVQDDAMLRKLYRQLR